MRPTGRLMSEQQKRTAQFMAWHRKNDGVRRDHTQNLYCEQVK
jgi:hypothetical protein